MEEKDEGEVCEGGGAKTGEASQGEEVLVLLCNKGGGVSGFGVRSCY